MNLKKKAICVSAIPAFILLLLSLPVISWAEDAGVSHPITAWPFVYSSTEGDRGETDVLWPLYRHEWKGPWERYALRPLLFNNESDPSEDFKAVSVLWPLNDYRRKKDNLALNLMLYWHRSTPASSSHILFPMYWKGYDKDSSYFHLWPLLGVNRDKSYTERSTLYPFFRYGTDPEKDEMDLHAFWPVVNYRSAPGYLSHSVLPVYWYEKGQDVSGGFVFPYYWRKTGVYQAKGMFPLWYSSRGDGLKTDFVFPLYYNHESSDMNLRILLPAYGKWEKGTSSFTSITPLYMDYHRDDLSLRAGLPLYWDYRNGPFSFSTVFPLYFHTGNADLASEFTSYFPLYGWYRRGDSYTRHFLFMPLYSHYTDASLGLSGWDVLWPLFNYESGTDRKSIRALPLFWHMQSPVSELSVGFPLYFSYKTQESSYLHFIPFYGMHTRGEHFRQRFTLGPAYISTEDTTPGSSFSRKDIIFPFYSSLTEENRERSWLFPFYYRNAQPDQRIALGSLLFLPPYYVDYHDENKDLFHIWPFYGYTREHAYEEYATLWPLIRFGSDPRTQTTLTQVLAYYRKAQSNKTETFLIPLWFHTATGTQVSDFTPLLHSYDHDSDLDRTKLALLWLGDDIQVFSYERQRDETLACRFLWKVLSYDRSAPGTSEFRFLWRLVRTSSSPKGDVLELNPFFYREQGKDNSSYWAILGGLIGHETLPDGSARMRYLWGL